MPSVQKEGRFPEAAEASDSETVEPQVAAVFSKALHFLSILDLHGCSRRLHFG